MDFEKCLFSIGYHICVSKILVISPYSKYLHIERAMHTFENHVVLHDILPQKNRRQGEHRVVKKKVTFQAASIYEFLRLLQEFSRWRKHVSFFVTVK